MSLNRKPLFEGLEHRTLLAADLVIAETVPSSQDACSSVDAGYLDHGLARPDFGDANCDGVFDSSDLVQIMEAGEYEDDIVLSRVHNSTWNEGDFNGDRDFDSSDLVWAMTYNEYQRSQTSRAPWDIDANGQFDSGDLVAAMQSGKYETGQPATSDEGDFNSDGVFDSTDMVFAMQNGRYISLS